MKFPIFPRYSKVCGKIFKGKFSEEKFYFLEAKLMEKPVNKILANEFKNRPPNDLWILLLRCSEDYPIIFYQSSSDFNDPDRINTLNG